MYDKDKEMQDFIDEHILGERTSDAAEDSSGAAWAAYERGEYKVPDWYSKEYKGRKSVTNTIIKRDVSVQRGASITLDMFLRSMGILFLILLAILIVTMIFN
tara:strand:- start:746 stop:1051 length:306 start_codon:yes stop_codon:yes gene_type:complete